VAQAVSRARELAATRALMRASQPFKSLTDVLKDVAAC
jgi:hypothetical protein